MWLLLLIPACLAAVLSCLRLVRVAAAFAPFPHDAVARPEQLAGVGLYETAYLAGGPTRVVDLVLVLMAGRGRLHLAHTGWTTVVDPQGRSRLERALIGSVGREGQCRTARLRTDLAGHPTVREIGERLAAAGLATPEPVRANTTAALRHVRHAFLSGLLLLVATLLLGTPGAGDAGAALAWFSLPLILTGGTLLMARVDVRPYTRWAAPAGLEVLDAAALPRQYGGPVDDAERELLTAVAMAGPQAVPDARLRAALRH
ncbi:TIGR04222 domain-containing membrane protein [Kitasatospora sp. NPDC088346]|uniref:TIGR04222 domain-containing membrane protein n=1 Tax=Kitasatospora sp. NPDC088346 TaxID=3364073 RepID=UPI003823B09F